MDTEAQNKVNFQQIPSNARAKLVKAGVTANDCANKSLDDLFAIKGVGLATLYSVVDAFGRWDDWAVFHYNLEGYVPMPDGTRVPNKDILNARVRRDVLAHFGYLDPETEHLNWTELHIRAKQMLEEVPWQEIAAYIRENPPMRSRNDPRRKAKDAPNDAPPTPPAPPKPPASQVLREISRRQFEAKRQETILKNRREEAERAKGELPPRAKKDGIGPSPTTGNEVELTHEQLRRNILAQLWQYYDAESAPVNDREQVSHLADMMARRRVHDRELQRLLVLIRDAESKKDDTEQGEKVADLKRQYEWEQRAVKELDAQIAAVEKSLRITPGERAAQQGAMQGWEVLRALLERTKTLRKERLVSHHVAGPDLMGFTVWHHPHDSTGVYCARCGSRNLAFRGLDGREYPFLPWTPEAEALYTSAASFRPSGAPAGIGVFDNTPAPNTPDKP